MAKILRKSSSLIDDANDKVLEEAEKGRTGKKLPLDMAQLRIANLQLHGRDKEMKLLKGKLRKLKHVGNGLKDSGETMTVPELLWIKGLSGTGKSALVRHSLKDPAQKMGIAFASGKFDVNQNAQPLSAFIKSMTSLTKFVVAGDHLQKIRDEIKAEFDEDDMVLLAQVFAGCKDLFPIEKALVNDGAFRRKSCVEGKKAVLRRKSLFDFKSMRRGRGGNRPPPRRTSCVHVEGKEDVIRLQYAIRRLLKVICSNLKGTVLFIDDLQWSDVTTLDLMRSISLDSEIPSLLLVGAYREDEVHDSHPLAIHIRELKVQRGISITTITVGNLSPGNVASLVADVLKMEDYAHEVAPLAATVHKKTAGNAFFVIIFLRNLCDNGLIRYNINLTRWMWDDEAISSTMVMQNVASIMIDKLEQFEQRSRQIVMVASCLGASFSTSVIAMIVEALEAEEDAEAKRGRFADCSEIASLIASSVDEFEKEGVWERESGDTCRFCHDQIQSAALELIPADEKNSFQGRVGNAMMKRLDPDLLEEFLFDAVSLQNCAMVTMGGAERKALAKMNLRAGLKASKNASFESSIVYFKAGRELLCHSWESDPITMLQLCSEEANARFIASDDLETMKMLIDEVLSQPIPVRDQFKAAMVKVKSLLAADNLHDCLETGLDFCKKLGLRVPNNKPASALVILKEYFKTRRTLRGLVTEEIAHLPETSDESIVMGLEILELLAAACYQAQPTLYPIMVFLVTRSSIKHGISAPSCAYIAAFGLLLCGVFGKLNEGREMARAAKLILANHDMKEKQSRVVFLVETFVFHWTAPLQASIAPLLKGYQIGLEMGDIESAGWCLVIRCQHLFFVARPLDCMQKEIDACVDLLSQLNLKGPRLSILPYQLTVTKLRGVDISEECMDFEEMLQAASESRNLVARARIFDAQLQLFVILNEWERAIELLIEAGDLRKVLVGTFAAVRFTELEALISLKAAQTSAFFDRIKWKRRGLKSMKMLRSWAKQGNVNVVHMLHVLSAELAVLEGKGAKAKESFESAIKVAARNGFVQDKALAHDLAGAYFTAQGDGVWVDYQYQKSQEAYADWGARANVKGNKE